MPCKHEHRGVRKIVRALQHSAAGHQATEQHRNHQHAGGILARQKRHQNSYISVAGVYRIVGASLHCGHFDHSSQPGAGAAEKAERQQHRGRWADRPIAPRADCRPLLSPRSRTCVRERRNQAARQAMTPKSRPSCTCVPGITPRCCAAARGRVPGLFRLAGSRIGPFDQVIEQGDRDVVQQQAADDGVDAAVVLQRGRDADPQAAGEHAGRGHAGRVTSGGRHSGTASPAATAPTAPMTMAPSLPITMRPARAGRAVHRPHSISGAARTRVFCHEYQSAKAGPVNGMKDAEGIGAEHGAENAEERRADAMRRPAGISRRLRNARASVAVHELLVFPITPSTSQSILSSSGSVTISG